ncbi:ASCH domain-containing protein [Ferruginibacter albus]|uniref:ASCH domain-containing protein n=1 Tax=Ferruginibacter albus TaxID=2875540 RepID=UPI001CC4DEE5|nr:ASCH domain-containing protein [Ferruginibacter albus]UAY51238.1 ASCH domain-containing protein [Ferruginibacter albus]
MSDEKNLFTLFVNMKALSLLQPWASLVMIGVKKIETRSWATDYRGTLLIHASQSKRGSVFANQAPFTRYIKDFNTLPFGFIIGQVTLEKILRVEDFSLTDDVMNLLTLEEKAFGDYKGNRFGWVLSDPVEFENKIPARGQLRLWEFF